MKFKTTQKEIKTAFKAVIAVPYCELQNLLNYNTPIAYTTRREGWGADVYDMGNGVAIATGYAPFGRIKADYKLCRKFEDMADILLADRHADYKDTMNALRNLQQEFIREVMEG